MELKVWVEGIQRIVCGVNEKTTCQDVVFALAHATGKTGRFTLIERWRNSERLLAPSEQPLKVLLKWGEHSNDVQFILQWSPLESANSSNRSGQLLPSGKVHGTVESSCSDNSSSHSPSPLSKPHQFPGSPSSTLSGVGGGSPLQTNGPKKTPNSGSSSSYTSNDSRLWSPYSQTGLNGSSAMLPSSDATTLHNGDVRSPSMGIVRGGLPTQRPGDHVFHGTTNKPSESATGKLVSSPPPYREPPSPSSHNPIPTPPLSSPQTGNMKSLPPYREPPPPNPASAPNFKTTSSNCNSPSTSTSTSGTSSGTGVTAVFNGGSGSSGSGMSSNNVNGFVNGGVHGFCIPSQKDLAKYSANAGVNPQQQQQDTHASCISLNEVDSWKNKDHSLINGDSSSNQSGSNPKASPQSYSSNSNSNYRELIRVVNSQREKLTSQQAELTQYDAEIMFWEGKSKEQQKHMDLINKEISRLEVVSAQHESQALSLAHLEEENEYAHRESEALKSEINSLRADLETCDDEIEQCKHRIRVLMEQLHVTQHQISQRHQEWLDKEALTQAEIDRLRKELEHAKRETDAEKELTVSLDHEVQSIETSLNEKKKQMERLVAAMKEANLQSLSIQPPEDLIEVHHRSGSTRRMIGSPRQLENAAPTSKNPHGVWV